MLSVIGCWHGLSGCICNEERALMVPVIPYLAAAELTAPDRAYLTLHGTTIEPNTLPHTARSASWNSTVPLRKRINRRWHDSK